MSEFMISLKMSHPQFLVPVLAVPHRLHYRQAVPHRHLVNRPQAHRQVNRPQAQVPVPANRPHRHRQAKV